MTELEERELAFSKLESIEGSEVILNKKACYPEIMEWAKNHLEEIVKLLPIDQWEPVWCYYLFKDTKVPEKYWDQLYKKVSEKSSYSYWLLRDTKVPEKYRDQLYKRVSEDSGYSYWLLRFTKVPEKYRDQLYKRVSEDSYYSYYLLREIEVPEKYQKLLEESAKKR